MVSRGPDDAGIHIEPGVGLAHRRLSIIDLTPAGRMPMADEEETTFLVFNGEVYNFAELRSELETLGHRFRTRTDSEVVLRGYREWGVEVFNRLDGMFAIGIWDRRRQEMILARDAAGEKPLFYAWDRRRLIFGSTLDSILAWKEPWSVDEEAVGDYLGFGFVRAPRTAVSGVRKMLPGTYAVFSTRAEPRVGTHFAMLDPARAGEQALSLDEVEDRVRTAVHSRLVADVPLGAFLSGGVDSSLVCALIAKAREVRTYTIGFDDPRYDESRHARAVAEHLGLESVTRVISEAEVLAEVPEVLRAFDEPMADYSALPTLAVSRLARSEVTVAVTGDGADELFGGYRYYSAVRGFAAYARVPAPLRRAVAAAAGRVAMSDRVDRALQRTRCADVAEFFANSGFFRGAVAGGSLGVVRPDLVGRAPGIVASFHRGSSPPADPVAAGMAWDVANTLPEAWLCKVDRCSMAVSLETRAPLLSKDVIHLAQRLPMRDKVRIDQRKVVLRRLLKRYLPEELVDRPKQGFTPPMARWMRGELAPRLEKLRSSALAERGLVSAAGLGSLVTEHVDGRADHAQLLWSVLALDTWMTDRGLA